ncbi:MAG: glutamyl-tRNA reductase [Chitinophagaceae bacterium]|nr:MAG: glutamyl-tRNA reductase [Chitinophagaceae bacterium]
MKGNTTRDIQKFHVAGINYKKTDASIRGQFAINKDQYASILDLAPFYGVDELFVLSTCNRTEIYGFGETAEELIQLLCTQTVGKTDTFRSLSYIKDGYEAIQHLFEVGAGLDSQILGDYEIIGQLKQAVKTAREGHFIGNFLDRVVNTVLQSSKNIKNQTQLSSGTVSVSFAAVQYIREHITDIADQNILLIGTGKIGRNTCKNIVDYLGTTNITLVNRTDATAAALADELGLKFGSMQELPELVKKSTIILVATNSQTPTLLESHLAGFGNKLIIDLSIPYNVEPSAATLPGITLINVDELSQLKDKTLLKRKAELPKARMIIEKHSSEFMDWYQLRRQVPMLKAVKLRLETLPSCRLYSSYSSLHSVSSPIVNSDEKIQQVINSMALKMRSQDLHGCQYIEAVSDFISRGKN